MLPSKKETPRASRPASEARKAHWNLVPRHVGTQFLSLTSSVYPLLQKHAWTTVGLEPEGARRTELIGFLRQAEESLQKTSPQKDEAFDTYTEKLFQYLLSEWHSSADVNASWTDRLFAVKHEFQSALYGAQESEGWEGWNHYFLDQIVNTAFENPGRRIVVIVGVEHGYWLREHLQKQNGITLLDTAALLQP